MPADPVKSQLRGFSRDHQTTRLEMKNKIKTGKVHSQERCKALLNSSRMKRKIKAKVTSVRTTIMKAFCVRISQMRSKPSQQVNP